MLVRFSLSPQARESNGVVWIMGNRPERFLDSEVQKPGTSGAEKHTVCPCFGVPFRMSLTGTDGLGVGG